MFQLSSQWVPIMFSIAPHFYPICLGKCCPPFTNIRGLKGRNYIHHNRTFYLEEFIVSFFCGLKGRNYIHHNRTFYLEEFIVSFFWSNGLIKLAHWKNITKWTWEASHLINRRGGQEWTCWGKWNNECFLGLTFTQEKFVDVLKKQALVATARKSLWATYTKLLGINCDPAHSWRSP